MPSSSIEKPLDISDPVPFTLHNLNAEMVIPACMLLFWEDPGFQDLNAQLPETYNQKFPSSESNIPKLPLDFP